MEIFFNNNDRKVKQKIQQVAHDNSDQQMDVIYTIMSNVRQSSLDCLTDGQELFVTLQNKINTKLEVLDSQVERLKELQLKLIRTEEEERKATASHDGLTTILNEINGKLEQQQDKMDQLSTYLPIMLDATKAAELYREKQNATCKKQKCISQKLLEITKGV